ncbi:MAG: alpha-L-fucosidase [Oliverpabstia sp.]
MIIKQYIKDFENLGFGMFVHFGLYSVLGKGEWAMHLLNIPDEEYFKLAENFQPAPDWAEQLVTVAKNAGCRYITLTTRHHDGYSLYDTCGLNPLDAPHTCGRDLVREFVDACRAQGIIPFFYHTLLDWHEKSFEEDFPEYLRYLRKSVEILCTNYGKIGGLWFDGMWSKPDADWEEDALYACIRAHQPEAMIINNTGLGAQGALGHIELDSVTFERGKPQPLNMEGAPKYIASEMCQVFADHWGYAQEDLNYKSPADMIRDLTVCRRYGSNLLMNVGPMGDGTLRLMDKAIYDLMGQWIKINGEAVYEPHPCGIEVENKPEDFLLEKDNIYYLFCDHLPMSADPNVALKQEGEYRDIFTMSKKIKTITWLDNGELVEFEQNGDRVTVKTVPYTYGRQLVVRVARIETEE